MSNARQENGLPAILAGLIVGPHDPVDFDDPSTMADLGSIRDEIVRPALNQHRGRLVEAEDVDIRISFATVLDAVSGALSIQSGMAARNAGRSEAQRYRFRFGIDGGGGEAGGGLAGMIAAACEPGDVCMDGAAEAELRQGSTFEPMDCGIRPLGPEAQPLQLYSLTPPPIASKNAVTGSAASQPDHADVRQGVVLNDTYRIESLIAQGGMGEVFRGSEIHSGGVVAIKLIRSDMTSNKVALGLFQREALILKDIYHDAIVRYFMFSFDPHLQRHYLAMEFVDGISLADLLKQGALPFEAVSTLRRRIASALFVAHERGIIHRDMSPDNVIIPGRNVANAKIIDFGIARATEIGSGTLIGGGFAGKYNYVSPEQLGLAGGEITPRSDIYSLGLVLAESILGKPLDMSGSQADVIEKRRQVPDLGQIDPRLRPLIEQMLQPDPLKRPDTMAVVAEWPTPGAPVVRTGRSEDARQDNAEEDARLRRHRRRQRWQLGGAVAASILLVGGLAVGRLWHVRPDRMASNTPHDLALGRDDLAPSPGSKPSADIPRPSDSTVQSGDTSQQVTAPAATSASQGTVAAPPPIAAPSPAQSTAAVPATPDKGTEAMVAYVKAYAASPCFVAKPVQFTATSALVEAFGLSRDDFSAFDRQFSGRFGFAPDVAGYRVWSKQCPALDFVRKASSSGPDNPYLLLKSMRVGSAEPISGEIRNVGDRTLTLLLAQEDGTVRNVSDRLKPNGDAQTFDLSNDPRTSPVPQLLIVIASQRPLAASAAGNPLNAGTLFPALLAEAAAKGQAFSVDTKLFLLGG